MTYSKCPNCGAIHPVKRAPSDRDEVRNLPCRTCRVNGELSRLAWEAPRRRTLIDLAVDAWNAVAAQPQGTDGLPLFDNTTKGEIK